MTTTRLRHRHTTLTGGPLHGNTARIYKHPGNTEPTTITLGHGGTHTQPWPHHWTTYHRWPDGTYRTETP